MAANNNSFYDAILSAGASMEKMASENDLAKALEETDLDENELNKLASEIEDALNDIDDIDDVDDVDENDSAENVDEASEDAEDAEDAEDDEEVDETDIEQLAAAYEEEYEKYASEGLGAREYVYNQVADEEFACTVGDMAEKLAYVADLPVFMVADDLINTISSKISEDTEG